MEKKQPTYRTDIPTHLKVLSLEIIGSDDGKVFSYCVCTLLYLLHYKRLWSEPWIDVQLFLAPRAH